MAIGAISLSRHTCVMLGAIQSPDFRTLESEQNMSMLDWYIFLVRSKASELLSLTDILVADAFFSKYEFVNETVAMGFRFVGRLRADSYLRYPAIPDPATPRKRGRKKKYGEKVISPTSICLCSLHSYMRIQKVSEHNAIPLSTQGR